MNITRAAVGLTVVMGWFLGWGGGNGVSAAAENPISLWEMSSPRYAYGQIAWLDVQTGRLALDERTGQYLGRQVEYVITPHTTNVTDPEDQQFLQLEDLKAGQFVQVEFTENRGRRMAQTVVVEPRVGVQQAAAVISGEIVLLDLTNREFAVKETVPGRIPPEMTYRIQAPEGVAFVEAQTGQPLRLEDLRVGQWVMIETNQLVDQRRIVVYGSTRN